MSPSQTTRAPGRNDPCPCGSGKKYKKCHGANATAGRTSPATGQGMEQRFAQAYQLFQQGAVAPAAEICADILQAQPNHIHANHLLGLCHYQQGDYNGALPYLERAVKLDPTDPHARNTLALTLGWLRRSAEAETHARRAMELSPNAAAPRVTLGRILVDLRRLPEAAAVLEQALAIDGRDPDSWYTLGKLRRTERRLADAKQAYEQVLSLAPNSVPVLNELGLVQKDLEDYDGAARSLEHARQLAPDDVNVLFNLGDLAIARGQIESARELFEQVIAVNDRHAPAYLYLWDLAAQQGDWNEAVRWLLRGAASCPQNREIHERLAVAYAERQEFPLAYEQIDMAVKIGGETVSTELARAEVCDRHHDREAAAAAFRRAVDLDPDNPELLLKFAQFEKYRNRFDDAADLAKRALDLDPSREAEVRIVLARAERSRRAYDRALTELTGLDFDVLPTPIQTQAWFELGALRDARGEYKEAFDAYTKGANVVVSSGRLHFDPEQSGASLKHDRDVLAPDVLKGLARFRGERGSKSTPIFVVGFMRSGTTLLEQILSSHPQVQAGDELVALPKLTQAVAGELGREFPDCLVGLDDGDTQDLLAKWRAQYLDDVRDAGVDVEQGGCFTDKNNLNLLYLPFITMLFPDSPIVHIVRNPMDCVFSNFVTNLGVRIPWAYDLEHAAGYYRDVMAVTEHYRDNLPMRYREFRYEDLVSEPEPVIREVADFVGLSWDESMVRFYENKRVARTPSHEQVSQPMYTRSVERYRNYEEFLAKPLAILEPLMRRYGYLES